MKGQRIIRAGMIDHRVLYCLYSRLRIIRILTFQVAGFVLVGLLWGGNSFSLDWKQYKSQHFVVYYNAAPEDFVENVAEMAESYYREITDNLGFTRHKSWNLSDRAKIYIYNDSDDYAQNARQANWSAGAASPDSKTIRTFPAAQGFFDTTLPHELGHIIFREFIGHRSSIPLWFEEGVAMYQEKAKRWGSKKVVQGLLDNGNFIPLERLSIMRLTSRSKQEFVNLFYAESASSVYYLISELGQSRFVRFCRKLREGIKFEEALESVYVRFENIEEFNESWVKYLKN